VSFHDAIPNLEPVSALELVQPVWDAAPVASAAPDSLIGRERELTLLRDLLEGVIEGTAATVLIDGEAGIVRPACWTA
jgi:hypothetical protein